MAIELQADEDLPAGLKRIAREQLDGALAQLGGERGDDLDDRVHEARKCLKKARAVIRLVRDELGAEVYRRENRRFRDAGRMLGPLRDGGVLVATLDRLAESGAIARAELAPLRDKLEADYERGRERVLDDEGGLERAAAAIAEGRAMVDAWPIDRSDSEAFRKSLRRTYARGRKAFGKAYAKPAPERFHELRKRVKYLWYYARFLEPAAPGEIGDLKDLADEAGSALGLDHDLAELVRVASEELRVRRDLVERVDRLAEQHRLQLQWQALPQLRRLFAESPKGFSARIASRFDVWRFELEPRPLLWLTPAAAARARVLLGRKAGAERSEQDTIRAELRGLGVELSALSEHVAGVGSGFEPRHLDELIDRRLIAVGEPSDFGAPGRLDRLPRTGIDVAPNEASGLCPINSSRALEARGWETGFWLVLDDTSVDEAVVAVGRPGGDARWQSERLPVRGDGRPATDDSEDCFRLGEWIYVVGSHYGSKRGPLERERQFVARFREAQLGDGEVDLQVVPTEYRLHRLVNDALAAAGIEPFPLAEEAREALIGGALKAEEDAEGDRDERIDPAQLPINIEGCAPRSATGGVLIGLRFPTSAEGHPLLVEVDDFGALFDDGLPAVKGVWEVTNVGSRWVPAGIRGLGEGEDGSIEALTGNLDSTGKDSVLVDAHPEAALARSAHFRLPLPGNRRGGSVEAEPVREFPGMRRVEGVAHDPAGRTFYVVDDEERIDLRYSEAPGSSTA
jgi:CHAD domain-containing protein